MYQRTFSEALIYFGFMPFLMPPTQEPYPSYHTRIHHTNHSLSLSLF